MQKFELDPPDEETAALLNTMATTPSLRPADPIYVRFYARSKQNKEKSTKEKRPIFESVEYVEVLCPGDKDTIIDRPVRNLDKYVWAEKYKAFRENREQDSGTPLGVWGGLSPERVEELAAFKVKTVEQLADVPDSGLSRLGIGARSERDKAKAYLLVMKDGAPLAEMKAENDALKARLEALEKLAAQSAPGDVKKSKQ